MMVCHLLVILKSISQGVKRNAIKIENGQNTEQPFTTLSVLRDARLCARVC